MKVYKVVLEIRPDADTSPGETIESHFSSEKKAQEFIVSRLDLYLGEGVSIVWDKEDDSRIVFPDMFLHGEEIFKKDVFRRSDMYAIPAHYEIINVN